jgi:hypothetical protein
MRVGLNHGMLKTEDMLRYQQVLDKVDQDEADKAVAAYVASGDPKHLTPVLKRAVPDVDLDGAKRGSKKNRNGHEEDGIVLKNGSFVPDTYFFGIMRQDKLLDAIDKRSRQEQDQERTAIQRSELGLRRRELELREQQAGEKPTKEDIEINKYLAAYKPTIPIKGNDDKYVPDEYGAAMVREIARRKMQVDKAPVGDAVSYANSVIIEANATAAERLSKLPPKKQTPQEFYNIREQVLQEAIAKSRRMPEEPGGSTARPPRAAAIPKMSPEEAQRQINQIPR